MEKDNVITILATAYLLMLVGAMQFGMLGNENFLTYLVRFYFV